MTGRYLVHMMDALAYPVRSRLKKRINKEFFGRNPRNDMLAYLSRENYEFAFQAMNGDIFVCTLEAGIVSDVTEFFETCEHRSGAVLTFLTLDKKGKLVLEIATQKRTTIIQMLMVPRKNTKKKAYCCGVCVIISGLIALFVGGAVH